MNSDNTLNEIRSKRTSFYLVQRAEALLGALRFFDAKQPDPRRQLRFLAQSDFWEWEIDNLIFSFTNFADRQETWRSTRSAVLKLNQLGIALDAKLTKQVRWRAGQWEAERNGRRIAPVALLREVLEVWNRLLDAAEKRFITPMQEKTHKWNIVTKPDLASLRRSMPSDLDHLDAEHDDGESDE